jgi:hypothetical protein
MTKEKRPVVPTEPPDDPCWIPRFAIFTWWLTSDNRVFLVIDQHLVFGKNAMHEITLLQQDRETPIKRPWLEVYDMFKKGQLRRTSTSV